MKKEYLDKLIKEIQRIDPRIEVETIQEGRGATFYGPSGNLEGRKAQKFFRVEDGKKDQFAGKYYSLENQERVRGEGSVESKKRSSGNLKAEPFKFLVGDDIAGIVSAAHKSFELLLKRR